jgi:hypothetical protein
MVHFFVLIIYKDETAVNKKTKGVDVQAAFPKLAEKFKLNRS